MTRRVSRRAGGHFPRLLGILLAAAWLPALAAAPSASQLFNMRLQNSANSQNTATGEIMFWGANDVVPPDTSYGFTRQCPIGSQCTSSSDPDYVRQSLFWRSWDERPNNYFASRPYDPALTGAWSLILSSVPSFAAGPDTVLVNTPALGGVAQMPFVQSMSVSGSGVTPTISWTPPATLPAGLSIDHQRILIFDVSHPVTVQSRNPNFPSSFQQGNLIHISADLPAAQTSYSVPASWTTPLGDRALQFGTHYSIGVLLNHLRDPNDPGSTDSRSASYFDFTPINLPNVQDVHLPSIQPVPTTSSLVAGPVYNFNVQSVSPTETTFIDPFVATGYTYMTGAGDPNFKSVKVATAAGDGLYDLFVWSGADWTLAKSNLGVDEVFEFGALGADRFEIRGIETSAELSPFDLTAFVTGLTFVSAGAFTGTMQAIAVEVPAAIPEPETYAMLLAGLGLLGWRARRR